MGTFYRLADRSSYLCFCVHAVVDVCVRTCICIREENQFVYKHLLVIFLCVCMLPHMHECVHVCVMRQMGNGPCAESEALCNVQS